MQTHIGIAIKSITVIEILTMSSWQWRRWSCLRNFMQHFNQISPCCNTACVQFIQTATWNVKSKTECIIRLFLTKTKEQRLTVATILRMAAEAMSSPLGWPTSVIPRYFTLNTIPSSSVSFVSVQFSGSSDERNAQDWNKNLSTKDSCGYFENYLSNICKE